MVESRSETVEFGFTSGQRRRYGRGLVGVAAMVWAAGLVRFTLVDRLSHPSGWVGLAVLAVLLGAIARALASVRPVTVLDGEGLAWRWGPRRDRVPWSRVTAVEVQERGTARRLVVVLADRSARLPVPLTGGSLVGPGVDPDLDHKVDLVRRWWVDHRPA